ncbi:MAG TPA: WG repeat-containing protein, partial [Bryobacteraceae bacterium]|nr:WG repeat-containing protein [Bryobacteraceae bacterium]
MHIERKRLGIIGALVAVLVAIVLSRSNDMNLSAGPGLFPVKVNGKYGFIDRNGKILVNPQFDDAGMFEDGRAPVALGKSWGFIDRAGKLVIHPQYELADPFSDGLALV